MTVCIAAICDRKSIVAASDRMLSMGDVRFEPQTPKIRLLTSSMYALTAGDAGLNDEVLSGVLADVHQAIESDPTTWVRVSDVASFYVARTQEARRKRAEAKFLLPLGLTSETFLTHQKAMDQTLVTNVTNAIVDFIVPYAECIIAGLDATGPHIFSLFSGVAQCCDSVGFACIGNGSRHADSQMMLAQHAPSRSIVETVALVHTAKKRAEIALGVGEATDMVVVSDLGDNFSIQEDIKGQLLRDYRRLVAGEARALRATAKGLGNYLARVQTATPVEDQSTNGAGA